jgi:integrase
MKRDTAYQRDTLLGPIVRDYLRYLEPRKQPRTIDSYEETLRWLCQDFPGTTAEEFTPQDLSDWIDLRWGHMQPATQRQRTACVRVFFQWASDYDRIEGKSPARQLDPPPLRTSQSRRRRAVPAQDMLTLIDSQPDLADRIAIQLLGRSAFRRDEMRLFQLKHFTPETGYLLVAHGKGGKIRSIPATDRLKADLGQYLTWEGHDPEEYLLHPWNRSQQPYAASSMPYWWEKRLKQAGLEDILMHELRYTAATRLYEATKDLVGVQRYLGHTDPKVTTRYLDLAPEGLEQAVAGLE